MKNVNRNAELKVVRESSGEVGWMAARPFNFERMDVYRLAVETNRWFSRQTFPTGRAKLRDQGQRAIDSVVLNIAEGLSKRGASRRHSLEIALGEAGEVFAVLDIVGFREGQAYQDKLRRIGAMLNKMSG